MEPWQQQGFASYKAWKQADNKRRYAAASPPPPLPAPHSSPMLVDESTSHEAMELDESTLAVLNPSTQDDALMASPAERRTLSQPTSSKLTPGGVNLLHRLEEATPRRTHVASAEYNYKAAAATPER